MGAKQKKPGKKKSAGGVASESTSQPPVESVDAMEIGLESSGSAGAKDSGRRSERVPFEGKVELRGYFAGGKPRHDRVKDVSVQGVFVETAHLLEVGDPVVLSFPLETGKKLHISGRVRWVTPFGGLKDARPGMGIELVGMEGNAKDALRALLATRRG